jgi:hypothetical protein
MCALENCQWCEEPYFAGAAISVEGFLPQIPSHYRYKESENFVAHYVLESHVGNANTRSSVDMFDCSQFLLSFWFPRFAFVLVSWQQ